MVSLANKGDLSAEKDLLRQTMPVDLNDRRWKIFKIPLFRSIGSYTFSV